MRKLERLGAILRSAPEEGIREMRHASDCSHDAARQILSAADGEISMSGYVEHSLLMRSSNHEQSSESTCGERIIPGDVT